MNDIHEIYERERRKWDEIARQQAQNPAELMLKPEEDFHTVAERSTVMVGVNEFLGDLHDKEVLELGCGSGKTAALLAKAGARVTAFDISPVSVRVAGIRAGLNGLADRTAFVVAVGERLPFADNSFDVLYGRAVLHHLDVKQGASEARRVLKPGGRAAFVEPLGTNPLLTFVRDHVPYPDKHPVGDDQPLNYTQIEQWGEGYSTFDYQEVHFLGMLERAFPYRARVRLIALHNLDRRLLKRFPGLRRYSRYIVLRMQK